VDGFLWSSGQIRLQISQGIKEVNAVPVLPSLGTQGVIESNLLTVTNTATEANTNSTVGYWLLTKPAGASIDTHGVITWMPGEADGPGSFTITTVATSTNILDTTNPYLSATNSFDITVREVNVAPILTVPPNQTISAQTTLSVSASATDADFPTNLLSYALLSPPAGMAINVTTGLITWTPNASQVPSTNVILVRVTDSNPDAVNGNSLSATNSFTVIVSPSVVSQPVLSMPGLTNSTVTLSWTAVPGRSYRVQYKPDLSAANWIDLPGDILASGNTASKTDARTQANRFYRVALLP
jgi:hypothetical protein